ncbi:MAG: hypothetical protein QM800_07510 [Paludibacter sp.]
MKIQKTIISVLFLLNLALFVNGQDNSTIPQRTPEQEAAKQTEKLQQELNLTQDQAKQVYEINLRYARERQISNTRSEAVERMKNKNADIQRVLSVEQNDRLQTKRYERTSMDAPALRRNQPSVSLGFRAPSEFRTNPSARTVPSNDMNLRSTYRQSVPAGNNNTAPQTVRRSVPGYNNSQPYSAPSTVRSNPSQGSSGSSRPASSGNSSGSRRTSEPASSSGRR